MTTTNTNSDTEYAELLSAIETAYEATQRLTNYGMYYSDKQFHNNVRAINDELAMWVNGLHELQSQGVTSYVTRDEVEDAAKFDPSKFPFGGGTFKITEG